MHVQGRSPIFSVSYWLMAALLFAVALFVLIPDASAQTLPCGPDFEGANDEPGQKDLTYGCLEIGDAPGTFDLTWNWDEIAWSGANSGDACVLFDTDVPRDNQANLAACVTIGGDPVQFDSFTLYSCNNSRYDRCPGRVDITPDEPQTSCTIAIAEADPFDLNAPNGPGDEYPNDTVATCVLDQNDVVAENLRPYNVCSYPSQQPNSDPSDCIRESQPTAIRMAEPIGATQASALPIGPLASVMGMAGLMVIMVLLWRKRAN